MNEPVGDYTADFLWPDVGLIIEVDGRESHATRMSFQADRARDAMLTPAGYRTLRFTYRDVTREPAVVANRVRAVRHPVLEQGGG